MTLHPACCRTDRGTRGRPPSSCDLVEWCDKEHHARTPSQRVWLGAKRAYNSENKWSLCYKALYKKRAHTAHTHTARTCTHTHKHTLHKGLRDSQQQRPLEFASLVLQQSNIVPMSRATAIKSKRHTLSSVLEAIGVSCVGPSSVLTPVGKTRHASSMSVDRWNKP